MNELHFESWIQNFRSAIQNREPGIFVFSRRIFCLPSNLPVILAQISNFLYKYTFLLHFAYTL